METDTVMCKTACSRYRHILYVLAAVFLSVLLTAGQAFASAQPVDFSFADKKVKAGQIVDGYIVVEGDSVTNGQIFADYDSGRLQLIKAVKAEDQDSLYVSINDRTEGKIKIAFADEAVLETGHIVHLQFKVSEKARPGDKARISADVTRIYDDRNEDMGGSEISCELVIAGDGSGNGGGSGDDPSDGGNGNGDSDNGNGSGNGDGDSDGAENDGSSQTGDSTGVVPLALIALLLSAGAIASVIRRRKRGKDE